MWLLVSGETIIQTHAQIVIIGGGIMGVGLLYHLAEEGCSELLLIEKGELTSGSTWHAAGQCPSLVGNYNLAKIHAYGNNLYPRLEGLTGQYVSWHASGGIRLAREQQDLDWFKYLRGISQSVGFEMEIIGPDEIRRIMPHMNMAGVIAGAYTTEDGHADPSGLTNAMARGATNMGAKIVRHNRVLDINLLPSGEWEVVTEQGNVIAETVVNAAGCYARQVSQMVGSDMPLVNMEHQYIVTGNVPEFVASDVEIPVIRDPRASSYIRQEQKCGLIGIYEGERMTEAWAPNGYPPWESDSELFPDDLDRLMPWLGHAMERLPILEDAGIKRIVNGAIPHPPDGPPYLGPVAGLKNFWLCCGSSFGIAQGAGCGKYLAQWMVHGDAEINMTGFDPRRLGVFADENYARAKGFQDYRMTYTTPLPGEELPAGRPRRTSPLYEKLKSKGGVFTETFGWERPKWYSPDGREENYSYRNNNVFEIVRDECLAVRERVGILDLSGFAKYDVSGPDAGNFLNRLCANSMPAKNGGIVLAHILSKNGRILGEVTVTRLGDDRYYLLSAAAAELRDLDHLMQGRLPAEEVTVENVTDGRGVLVLAGPRAREVLAKLTRTDLTNASFRWLTAREISIAGIPLRALRVNYVGELGWELHPAMQDLPRLYEALSEAGSEFGIADFGLYAVNSLRIEKGYRGWGGELTNEVTMLDADMERFLKLDKDHFTGKEATLMQLKKQRLLQLVYFEVDAGDSDVRGNEPIFSGGTCVGVTTSGGYGHFVRKSLGFGYVTPGLSSPGTELEIGLLGERRRARVRKDAAHDPDNDRLRA
ncbi:MAG: FAD-dependent oxidoreductase [Proteobacteria bacterium]|nr:FAD-dependent oxidoreductase [Pseudomonadota bacterium]